MKIKPESDGKGEDKRNGYHWSSGKQQQGLILPIAIVVAMAVTLIHPWEP